MATSVVSHHQIDGALGPILIDVRTTSPRARQPAVLVLHGFRGYKSVGLLVAIAERLARAGFTAVNVSVSGAGVDEAGEFQYPERFAHNTYSREMNDIRQVIAAILEGKLGVAIPSALGLLGYSRGGGVALCIAREVPAVDAVVTWAAIATIRRYTDEEIEAWRALGRITTETRTGEPLPMDFEIVEDALAHADRFDIGLAARLLQRPWLLVQGTEDDTVPVEEGGELALQSTDERFESLLIPGADHAFTARQPWERMTPQLEKLFNATTRFFSRHLG
jgi:uncharacterized protein